VDYTQIRMLEMAWLVNRGRLHQHSTHNVTNAEAEQLIAEKKAERIGDMPFDITHYAQDGHRRGDVTMLKAAPMPRTGTFVHVLGSGPSASKYLDADLDLDFPWCDHTIACNAAGALGLSDVNIVVEGEAVLAPWFPKLLGFNGITIFEQTLAPFLTATMVNTQPESWWKQVLWGKRLPHEADLRNMNSLIYHRNGMGGSVALAAIGVAILMGATEIHTWGVELCFPNGVQHFDGFSPYTEGDTTESLITVGGMLTTPYFRQAAKDILQITDACHGVTLVDHSGGLLSND